MYRNISGLALRKFGISYSDGVSSQGIFFEVQCNYLKACRVLHAVAGSVTSKPGAQNRIPTWPYSADYLLFDINRVAYFFRSVYAQGFAMLYSSGR